MPAKTTARRVRAEEPNAAPTPPAAPPAPTPISLPVPQGWWKALALLLAFGAPGAGALLALLYWSAPAGAGKGFSRWCLGLSALGLLMSGATDAFHAGGDWLIQPY
jgi:hypothetical protein